MPLTEERNIEMVEYPYYGAFYEIGVADSSSLIGQKEEKRLVLETVCDIQRTAKLHNGNLLGANYTVYFPLPKNPDATGTIDKFGPIDIRRGMTFEGEFYGYKVEGQVEIVRPSQLGGCSCDIKIVSETDDSDEEEEEEDDDDDDNSGGGLLGGDDEDEDNETDGEDN
jgi:hypothetical protein